MKYTPIAGIVVLILMIIGCSPATFPETGTATRGGFIVTLDNPDFIVFNVQLNSAVTKWNGVMPRTIDADPNGFRIGNGDFTVSTTNGDGPAISNGLSYFASVGNEEIPARPNDDGHYETPTSVALRAEGLRVGYTPLNAQLFQYEPNHLSQKKFTGTQIRLHPAVALVPVEAVVVYHEKDSEGRLDFGMDEQGLSPQLAFWDRVLRPDTTNVTDGQYGEITAAIHKTPWYRRDANGQYNVGTQTAPDTVFDKCGVQFRLVNYFEMQVPTRNVFPVKGGPETDPDDERLWPEGTFDDGPLNDNVGRARKDRRHMEGTVIAIFMRRAAFVDAPERGRAMKGAGAIGVSLTEGDSTDGVVAHELLHLTGMLDIDPPNPKYNVMINPGPGVEPTDLECRAMKQFAENYRKFWTKPHRYY